MLRIRRSTRPESGAGQIVTSGPVVVARGLMKAYRTSGVTVEALRGVDLDVARGEFLAIVGPSGNGKSTLLNCLSGLDDIDAGSVLVNGRDLAGLDQRDRARLRVSSMGFIFQSFNLIGVLSAVENVEVPLLAQGSSARHARAQATMMLHRVGVASRRHHRPAELSGGQQQRVAIARALVTAPKIIWADEPTGNLDEATAASVADLFEEVNREGQTIVMVTHDVGLAARADRCVVVVNGRVEESRHPLVHPMGA